MFRSLLFTAILADLAILAHCASFTDDKGIKHDIQSGAKIITGAMDAVTLFHFGMEASQIEGTLGERSASGSNFGGVYFDGNIADHGDHAKIPFEQKKFPSGPDESERNFLNMIPDFSPSCSSSNYYCAEVDIAAIKAAGWPDLMIFGSFYGSLLSDDLRGNATEAGVPIIQLTTSYGTPDDEISARRSMIGMTERWEELAGSLTTPEAASKASEGDKVSFCNAVVKFQADAKLAQDKGVRALPGYLPYQGTGENGEIGAFIVSPEKDTVLSMLEENGMAILHNDAEPAKYYEYFTDFTTGSLPFENIMSAGGITGDPVPYFVDFWLYDDRVTLDFISDAFAQSWPNKALLSKQYAPYPANSRIFSYRHAADILAVVGEPLSKAVKIETMGDADTTNCTPAAEGGISGEIHREKGMLPGQYTCYEPIAYDICKKSSAEQPTEEQPTSSAAQMRKEIVSVLAGVCTLLAYVIV